MFITVFMTFLTGMLNIYINHYKKYFQNLRIVMACALHLKAAIHEPCCVFSSVFTQKAITKFLLFRQYILLLQTCLLKLHIKPALYRYTST